MTPSAMTANQTAEITGLYRYPIKGLTPESLPRISLRSGQTLPADRRYAIENGPSGFDPDAPQWKPKIQFLMLARNERLASLDSRFEDATNRLTIRKDGQIVASGDLETAAGRAAIEGYFSENFQPELKGPPKVLSGRDHSFSDVARKVVSIINLDSVRALETMLGRRRGPPSAFPRQSLREGLAGLVRARPRRPDARDRAGPAGSGQAHQALPGHQCRP
ncbi:uncharacterized protein YcbX [Bradyrhizobium sp. LM6.11]